MKTPTNFLTLFLIGLLLGTTQLQAQDTLPFREPPSASTTGKTLADSKHQWRTKESHLPADSPNIVIFMTDDAGFAIASTFGGPINTPTLDRLAATGISYNEFHTTAMWAKYQNQPPPLPRCFLIMDTIRLLLASGTTRSEEHTSELQSH